MEDTPEKLELKSKLEGLIFFLMTLVSHNNKFGSLDVTNCFNETIMEKGTDFSALDASLSFEKLEKYASNILRHPWRKEYRAINSYGGSFKHHVSNCLVGTTSVLRAMGYRERKDSSGNIAVGQYVLEEFIDPDKLTNVALACMIAFVECQVMLQIQEMLKNKAGLKVSFTDIFSVRQRFIGGMDMVVNLLTESGGTASNIPSSLSLTSMTFPSSHGHTTGSYLPKTTRIVPVSLVPYDLRHPHQQHHSVTDGHRSVPSNHSSFDLLEYPTRDREVVLAPLRNQLPSPSYSCHPQNSFLFGTESNGVTSPLPPPAMFANDSSPSNLSSLRLSSRLPPTTSRTLDQSTTLTPIPRSGSEHSNLRHDYQTSNTTSQFGPNRFQPPPVPPVTQSSFDSGLLPKRSSLKLSSVDEIDTVMDTVSGTCSGNPLPIPLRSKVLGTSRWSCSHCTFVNNRQEYVCEMCHKSREKGADSNPLVSGGKECSSCTLVNSRDAKFCRACTSDLIDSPTYI